MKKFEKEWRRRFERFAQQYEADHLISGWSESGLRRRLSLFHKLLLEQELETPAKMLDLGCGAGTYVRLLADSGHWVVGLDYSLGSLYRAQVADPKRAGQYVGGAAYNLPFRDECFDLVVSIGVLQALESPKRVLDEMTRVLRPMGILVIDFLNAYELVALGRTTYERVRGQGPRLRTYSPFLIRRWITQRGIKPLKRGGIYLVPRRLHWFDRILNCKQVIKFMERFPGLPLACAHAFLFFGKKMSV